MTKFNIDTALEGGMKITDPKDAQQYLKAYTRFIQKAINKEPARKGQKAEQIAKSNLAYFAGYYDNETRERIERLFSCAHPIFGSIKENGAPGPKKAFEIGVALGKKMKKQQEDETNRSNNKVRKVPKVNRGTRKRVESKS